MEKVILIGLLALLLLALLAGLLLPALSRARAYSGGRIWGNLSRLQNAKMRWEQDHKGGAEWPGQNDLLPYFNAPASNSFDKIIRPLHGEIYLINRTGQPVFAYFPTGRRKGEIVPIRSNDLWVIMQNFNYLRVPS